MKRLIVNADDFGLAESVNLGIVKAHREGIVTSASLLSGGDAASHAAFLARENPSLGVGVHLCLTRERPVLLPESIPGITGNGRFYSGPLPLMARLYAGLAKKSEIEAELRAQVERALSLGVRPTHLDGHQHMFIMPGIFPIVVRLAREYNIGRVRFPSGPRTGGAGIFRYLEKSFVQGFADMQKNLLDGSGLKRPDFFFGLEETGRLNTASLMGILGRLPEGTSELMCHPGLRNDALADETGWGFGWNMELRALTNASVKTFVEKSGIELVNFGRI